METFSPRFKSLVVTAGLSFWFFIIISAIGYFSIEALLVFIAFVLITTQILATKISKGLDVFAIINTKIFLSIFFGTVFFIYGILFRFLRIHLLRLRKQHDSYWLDPEQAKPHRIRKQY